MSEPLDEVDLRIVTQLRRDGRASISAVAQAAHISRANAYSRVARLVDAGVITGFTAKVDPVRVGKASSAYVTMRVDQANWHELRDQLIAIPEVEHVALVGGDFDVLLLVRARDNEDLRRVVLEELQSIAAVRDTKTALIFEDHDTR
ncbi:Lrp/AsnC family transcriptional regulator [Rathayibacter soli]|uniref:Lrp/AsnC family transcriptional regulator n=1 Tax=Rathayibacter soli TaxID=3144168 RepID=UPI0027E3D6BE|nr:Lrp/AsnC family transcriptional regulator [Glaciibacter superstes]